ncbi:hypothetical protein RUM43_011724 [Polyplax serrata]|uniref:Uncharacterized protein n=1 Tax=Polyplax serrata TaxID=468196 RepID=A0AAN8PTU7_POLSC
MILRSVRQTPGKSPSSKREKYRYVKPSLGKNDKGSEEGLKRQSLLKERVPSSQESIKNDEDDTLQKANFYNFIKALEPNDGDVQNLIKRYSADLDRESEDEGSEGDGYGYDEDEYYHFHIKRNDDSLSKTGEKENMQGNKENPFSDKTYGMTGAQQKPEDSKETQTVEMLSFKESHPSPTGADENMGKSNLAKPMAQGNAAHKKGSSKSSALYLSDLKSNSAIDDKMKNRKDESAIGSAGAVAESKGVENKKQVKVGEEKDALKLKDAKFGDESDKKEKEANVKESKESLTSKNMKENVKNVDEKKLEGDMKTAKLGENVDKISSKSKEAFAPKLSKDREADKLSDKVNSAVIVPNDAHSRVSYKDTAVDSAKSQGLDEEETDSDEFTGKNVGLSDYQEDVELRKDNVKPEDSPNNYKDNEYKLTEEDNRDDASSQALSMGGQDESLNDFYQKEDAWRDYVGAQDTQQAQQAQESPDNDQLPQNSIFDHASKSNNGQYRLNLPQNELESTDYHKNYMQSLKHYKGLDSEPGGINLDALDLDIPKALTNLNNLNNMNSMNFKIPTVGGMGTSNSKSFGDPGTFDNLKKLGPDGLKGNSKRKRSKNIKKKSSSPSDDINIPQQDADISAQLKAIYSQLNSMQQQQQQQQQSMPLPHSLFSLPSTPWAEPGESSDQGNSNRETRKTPTKLEYEIKIINQNPQGGREVPLSMFNGRRRKKEVKSKSADQFGDKFIKKYPYSQVSRDDLSKFGTRKFKRKAPLWMNQEDVSKQSEPKNRGAPTGYYSNRVIFGQKHYLDNEDSSARVTSEPDPGNARNYKFAARKLPSENENDFFHRSWRDSQEQKRYPIKRFDDPVGSGGKNLQNSLLLVKKDRNGERIAKTFVDANRAEGEGDLDSEHLAKMLSKDNDYIVLKKTDKNKFQKVDSSDGQGQQASLEGQKRYDLFGLSRQETANDANKNSRGTYVRSYRSSDQKLHNSGAKSSLKKTFEKFKDFADFFKDSDQDATASQHSSQQVKEAGEIVFSEDKIPDPIIITNEMDSKTGGFSIKTPNSMPTISNNFKMSDQQEKKIQTTKMDNSNGNKDMLTNVDKSNWEPTLKNIFPEANSINSMQKNGNEIIVLDFNRNPLKTDHGNQIVISKPLKDQTRSENGNDQIYIPYGAVPKNSNPSTIQGERQIEVFLNDGQMPGIFDTSKSVAGVQRLNDAGSSVTNQQVRAMPFNQLAQLPFMMKQATDKGASSRSSGNGYMTGGYKSVSKKSPQEPMSDNFNQFLRDYRELSEINKEQMPKKQKLNRKRNSGQPSSAETDSDSVKSLGDILQSLMNADNMDSSKKLDLSRNGDNSYEKAQGWQPQTGESSLDVPQRTWTTAGQTSEEENNEDSESESDYQNDLWEELSAASSKVQRLRREGVPENKLREIMEVALPFREKRHPSASHEGTDSRKGSTPLGSKFLTDDDAESVAEDDKTKSSQGTTSHLDKSKRNSKSTKSSGTGPTGTETDSVVNFNSDRDQMDELISSGDEMSGRDMRRTWRRKRSPVSNSETKVSKTEVENKILESFQEDNYQSVYSPGIRRKLLSINDDKTEDAETYKNGQPKDNCVKNSDNKCIDPFILNLFRNNDNGETREKRSLSGASHSNYKREIDLDESMPNDFQNFLVTSLGLDSHVTAFGSHGRKEPGGQDGNDMNLEKRDVSNEERLKKEYVGGVRKLSSDGNGESFGSGPGHVQSKYGQGVGYKETELPTQIRIQVTKASAKEKKSSELNDGEYSGNKLPAAKLMSKEHYAMDADDSESSNEEGNYYVLNRPYRRLRRKKKKHAQENQMKPTKDYVAFDQKAMENLIRKYFSDQRGIPQKLPASNHLPQVDTIYNPTQGRNKAQVQGYKPILKTNSLSNKNAANVKNSFRETESASYDDEILRSYLKDKPLRGNSKQVDKEFENVDWKPYAGVTRPRESQVASNAMDLGNYKFSHEQINNIKPDINLVKKTQMNEMKWTQIPNINYLTDGSTSNLFSINSRGVPLKSGMGNTMADDQTGNSNANVWHKLPNYLTPVTYKNDKEKNNLQVPNAQDDLWSMFDRYDVKKPLRDYLDGSRLRCQPFLQTFDEDKPALLEHLRSHVLDTSKDTDYGDTLDDEYLDGDELKAQPQFDPAELDIGKKYGKPYDLSRFANPYAYKNPEAYDFLNDDEEEIDEDYDENNEDLWDEYSLLQPELTKSTLGDVDQLKGGYYMNDPMFAPATPFKASDFELHGSNIGTGEMRNVKGEDGLDPAIAQLSLSEPKNDVVPYGSTALLQKVNENANILGKNLIRNLNRFNYDSNLKNGERALENQIAFRGYRNPSRLTLGKERQNSFGWRTKLKRSHVTPIGSRFFYASKTESSSNDAPMYLPRTSNDAYLSRMPKRSSLNAEFRSSENEFEDDSEENAKHFTGNLGNGEQKNTNVEVAGESHVDDSDSDKSKDSDEEKDEYSTEDVEDNMEDDSETISEDNVLENVIGKYIMRKSVKVKGEGEPNENESKSASQSGGGDKLQRRKKSVGEYPYDQNSQNSKFYCKRMSPSGHLTESNFKKYHKQSLNQQQKMKDSDREPREVFAGDDDDEVEKVRGSYALKGRKRSFFWKLGGREKLDRKEETANIRGIGFEPIVLSNEHTLDVSSVERKSGSSDMKEETAKVSQDKSEFRVVEENSKVSEKKKEKNKDELESQQEQERKVEGPWKIELNEKDDGKGTDSAASNNLGATLLNKEILAKNPGLVQLGQTNNDRDVKAYLVIPKNARAVEVSQNPFSPSSGASKREVGTSYLPYTWKETEDDSATSPTSIP